jgi:hypothetical protein
MGGMKLRSTNPKFGMKLTYESESKDSFVKEMEAAFYSIAKDWHGGLSVEEAELLGDDPIEQKASELREEFCKWLEEVKEDLFTETEKADIEEVMRRR